jgi:hypothetical protein
MLDYARLLFSSVISLFIVVALRRHVFWEGVAGNGGLIHILVS